MARKAKTPIRNHQMVPVSVIDHLLDRLVEGDPPFIYMTENEVMKKIGYIGRSAVTDWRKAGKAPKRAQYALMGLLAEQQHKSNGSAPSTPPEPEKQFTFQELSQIFAVLLTEDGVVNVGARARLQSKIAAEMQRYVNGG
jgi:hypothetical protein